MATRRDDETVPCPRCGYDLRSERSRWITACPLRGLCVECGFAFEWWEVFTRGRHPWLFETEWRYQTRRRIVRTVLLSFAPRRFWRSVRLTDPIDLRPPGLLALAAVTGFLLVVEGWAILSNHQVVLARQGRSRTVFTGEYAIDLLIASTANAARALTQFTMLSAVMFAMVPLSFLTISFTLRRARVRPAHVARIWLYSMIFPMTAAAAYGAVQITARLFAAGRFWRALSPWHWVANVRDDQSIMLIALRPSLVPLIFGGGTAVWLLIWWICAARHYLRLPAPYRLVVTLVLIATLTALVAEFALRR